MSVEQAFVVLAIGFAAGLIGGLAGIGGSLVMIPGLALCLGYPSGTNEEHHLYMTAAMLVNIVVAVRATRKHASAGAVRTDLTRRIVSSMIPAMVFGVLVSNALDGSVLRFTLAAFVGVYCLANLARAAAGPGSRAAGSERTDPARLSAIGATAGVTGGLLGLGGGVVMVPMLQVVSGIALRQAVATSAHAMQFSSAIGAGVKLVSLPLLGLRATDALFFAALMAPTALLGAPLGAWLTHHLPVRWARAAISLVLLASAARMAGLF